MPMPAVLLARAVGRAAARCPFARRARRAPLASSPHASPPPTSASSSRTRLASRLRSSFNLAFSAFKAPFSAWLACQAERYS